MTLTLALATPVLAGLLATAPLDQAELVRLALARDPDVVRARAALEAARTTERAAGRWLHENPELALTGELSGPFGGEERELEAVIAQPLEVAGQRGLRREAAQERLRAARAELRVEEAKVRAQAVSAHVELFVAQERHRLAREMGALARGAAKLAPQRVRSGDLSPVDATLVAAEALRFTAQEHQALRSLQEARTAVGRWVADPSPTLEAAPPPAPAPPPPVEQAEGTALAALQASDAQLRAALSERRLLDREVFPDPTLALGYKRVDSTTPLIEPEQLLILQLAFPLPLFDRGEPERAQARALERERESELRSLRQRLPHELRAARERLLRALEHEQDAAALRPELRRAFETIQTAFQQGQLGWSDYQLKRNALLEATADTLESIRERVLAAAELERLLARDDARDEEEAR